jgi:hypothetical protein
MEFKQTTAQSGVSNFAAGQMAILQDVLNATTSAMKAAKAEGAGFAGQMGAGSVELLKFLNPLNMVSYSAQDLGTKLKLAREKSAELSGEFSKAPKNIYLQSWAYQAQEYVKELERAYEAQQKLAGNRPGAISVRRTDNAQTAAELLSQEEAAAARRNALKAAMTTYATDTEQANAEIKKQKDLLGDLYTPELEARIRKHFIKPVHDSANAFADVQDAAKSWAKYWQDFKKIGDDASASVEGLTKGQQKLVEFLQSPAYEKMGEGARQLALQEAYAAIATEQLQASIKELTKDRDKELATLNSSAQSQANQLQRLQDEEKAVTIAADKHLTLAQAIELVAIARLQEEQAKQMSYGDESAASALQREIDARREMIALIGSKDARTAAKKAADDQEKEFKRASGEINRAITDSLFKAFESGEGFAKTFSTALQQEFKQMVLRPTVSAVMTPISQGVNSMIGATAGSTAGGAAGSGALGWLTGAGSAYGAFSGAASSGYALAAGGNAMATFSAGAEMVSAASGLSSAAAGMGQMMGAAAQGLTTALAAIPVWGWAALAVIAATQMKGDYVKGTGYADVNFGAGDTTGNQNQWIDRHGGYNPVDMFVSPEATKFVQGMQQAYINSAKSLGIGAAATTFGYSGNNADGGLSVVVGGTQGGGLYQSGEIKAADTAGLALASSRAIFTALQSSELPPYLANVFNGITASTATQADIDAAMGFASALKTTRDALTETRSAQQILTDTVNAGYKALGTSADSFKTDFVAAIDAGLTPTAFNDWKILETNVTALGDAAGTASNSVADIAANLKSLEKTGAQLAIDLQAVTDPSGARAAQRLLDTSKFTPDEIAQYDTNAGYKTQIETAKTLASWTEKNAALAAAADPVLQRAYDKQRDLTGVTDIGVQTQIKAYYAQLDLNDANAAAALIAESKLSVQQQIDVLTGQSTQLDVDRANALRELNNQDPSGALATLTQKLWGLKDAATAAAGAWSVTSAIGAYEGNDMTLANLQQTASAALDIVRGFTNAGITVDGLIEAVKGGLFTLSDFNKQYYGQDDRINKIYTAITAQTAVNNYKPATQTPGGQTSTYTGPSEWEQAQARQLEKTRQDFERLTDEMARMSSATGYAVTQRRRELSAMSAANQALQSQVWYLQDTARAQQEYNSAIANAKGNLDSARAAVDRARSAQQSIQQVATNNYISAQQKVATAQQRIVDLYLESAKKLQDTGKSLREFVSGEISSASDPLTGRSLAQSEFSRLLGLANKGDTSAYDLLGDAGRKLIDTSKEVMGAQEFEVVRRGVLRTISDAATAADLAAKAAQDKANLEIAGSSNKDAMLEATLALTDAQLEVAIALEVANAINAPLAQSQRDLVAEYTDASATLADAITALTAAQAALNAIVFNTATMVTAVDNLTALQSTALSADATINFVLGSELPQDLKDLATKGSDVKTMVSFLQGVSGTGALSDAQMLLATGVLDMVNVTTNFLVGAELPNDIKQLALLTDNAIVKTTYSFLQGAALDADAKTLALKASDALTRTVNFVVGSDGLDDSTRKIALNTTGGYTTLVSAALAPTIAPGIRDLILTGAGDYSATVKAIASSDLTTGMKNVLLNQVGDYTTTLKGVLDSGLDATTKGLLLGTLNTGVKSISLSASFGTALTADQRNVINAVDQTVLKTIQAVVSGGSITAAQQSIFDAVGQGNTSVYKTLTAAVSGGTTLTQTQQDLIKLATGSSTTTITLGGEVKMSAGTTLGDIFKAIHISGLNSYNMLGAIHNSVKTLNDNYIFGTKFTFDWAPYVRMYDNQNYNKLGQTSIVNPAVSLGPTSPLYSALGNIFDAGSVQAFAGGGAFTNRLVSNPTLFDLGVMGEAGPEAIMPLHRGVDGSLGVRAEMFYRGMHENLQGENMGARLDRIAAELQETRKENAELRKRVDQLLIEATRTASATKQMATNGVQVFNEATEPLHTAA